MPEKLVNPWLVAIAVMFATFMEVLDTTVVNVSLPHIASSMSATTEEATWALTSYLVANAIILPMTGWLAGRFGRKNLLMLSMTGFTIASFLCGVAPNLASLIIFRIIQGATGGALQPLSQAVLLESFKPEERGRAMGFWGIGIVVAPILGPVVGGWLTENYSWRWVFYINLPVGIIALLMTRLFVFDPPYLRQRQSHGHRLLGHGPARRRHRRAAVRPRQGAAGGLVRVEHDHDVGDHVGGGARRAHRLRAATPHPIVDLRLFKDRSYAVGVFLMTVLGFALYGSLVLLPIMLQTLFGYSSLAAGEAMAPRGIGSLFMMPLVGVLTAYVDPRKLLATGLIVGGCDDAVARRTESRRRILGLRLAAVAAGARHVAAVRAAHHRVDGDDLARAHGIRDQPVQPDAQHRRQHRHRRHRHDAGAAASGVRVAARRARHRSSTRRRTRCWRS